MSETKLPAWDLTDQYIGFDDPQIQSDLSAMDELRRSLASLKEALGQPPIDANSWNQALEAYDRHAILGHKLADYARLRSDEDVTDQIAAAFNQKILTKLSQAESEISFFPLMVAGLLDEDASVLKDHPVAGQFMEFIRQARRVKPHLLPEDQERLLILTLQREREAWARFENQLNPRLPFGEMEVDGQKVELTPSLIGVLLEHPDRKIRSEAYGRRCEAYAKENPNLTFAYTEQVRNVLTEKDLRKYPDIFSWVADRDDLPVGFVPELLAAAEKHRPIFTRFFAWKAKQMNTTALPAADMAAPLASDASTEIAWDKAKDMVVGSFTDMGSESGELSKKFFDNSWVHAKPLPHKAVGAYCMFAPDHPFVLLSYQGKLANATTLAHEVGHGVHALLFAKQKMVQRHPGLILAETASQFGELLFLRRLKEQSPEAYKTALRHFIEHSTNAIYQQTLITRFEEQAFVQAEAQGLTADWLAENWLRLKRALGENSIDYPDQEKWTWARISHIFFHPFYCYTYSASLLLVFALAKKHEENPREFAISFKELLAAGGSEKADDLLKRTMGFGLDDGVFFKLGFEYLEKLVDECLS
ncbi:MAG: M3 family metallopeptidase [Patescibacteria group bacterium]|nr:M3 family metallopeptidase [Patescibacteria group bacterium]